MRNLTQEGTLSKNMRSFNVSKQVNGSLGPFFNVRYHLCQKQSQRLVGPLTDPGSSIYSTRSTNFRVYLNNSPKKKQAYNFFYSIDIYWVPNTYVLSTVSVKHREWILNSWVCERCEKPWSKMKLKSIKNRDASVLNTGKSDCSSVFFQYNTFSFSNIFPVLLYLAWDSVH